MYLIFIPYQQLRSYFFAHEHFSVEIFRCDVSECPKHLPGGVGQLLIKQAAPSDAFAVQVSNYNDCFAQILVRDSIENRIIRKKLNLNLNNDKVFV